MWQEIGVLGCIGLTEIKHYLYHFNFEDKSLVKIYEDSVITIAQALISFIKANPLSHYPLYGEHLIDIEPAMRFLYLSGFKED